MKNLTDVDVRRIDFTPVQTTVSELGDIPAPRRRPQERRVRGVEETLFCLDAIIVHPEDSRPQNDGDVHVILIDPDDPDRTMIAEFPDVRCAGVCTSRFTPAIAAAREAFERKLATMTEDTLRVRIVGVGFFDRNHGQLGAAPNFIELHPVLGISFR